MQIMIKDSLASGFVSTLKQRCGKFIKSTSIENKMGNAKNPYDKYAANQTTILCILNESIPRAEYDTFAKTLTNLCNSYFGKTDVYVSIFSERGWKRANGMYGQHISIMREEYVVDVIKDTYETHNKGMYIYIEESIKSTKDSLKIVDSSHLLNLIRDAQVANNQIDKKQLEMFGRDVGGYIAKEFQKHYEALGAYPASIKSIKPNEKEKYVDISIDMEFNNEVAWMWSDRHSNYDEDRLNTSFYNKIETYAKRVASKYHLTYEDLDEEEDGYYTVYVK